MTAAFPYFFIAFASAGLQAVIPQHHFAGRPDDARFVWTSACLALAAVGRLVGVWISSAARPGPRATTAGAAAFGACFAASVLPLPDVLFSVVFIAANLLSQLVFDTFDGRIIRSRRDGLEAHARIATSAQLLGFVTGPAWFGVLADAVWPHLALVGACTVALVVITARPAAETPEPSQTNDAPLARDEASFLVFGLCTYAAMFVFVSSFVPVVRDLYRVPDATAVAGVALAFTNTVSIGTVGVARRFAAPDDPDASWRPAAQLGAVVALGASLVVLALRPAEGVAFLFALAVPVGAAYGLFLLRARAFASARSLRSGRGTFLSSYNNLSNGSALVAFGVVFELSALARTLPVPFLTLALGASAVLAAAAAGVAAHATLVGSAASRGHS